MAYQNEEDYTGPTQESAPDSTEQWGEVSQNIAQRLHHDARPEDGIIDVWPSPKTPSQPSVYIATRGSFNSLIQLLVDDHGHAKYGLSLRTMQPLQSPIERLRAWRSGRGVHEMFTNCWVNIRGGKYDGDIGWVQKDSKGVWCTVKVVPRVSLEWQRGYVGEGDPSEEEQRDAHSGKRPADPNWTSLLRRIPPPPGTRHPPCLLHSDVRSKLSVSEERNAIVRYEETGTTAFAGDLAVIQVRRSHLSIAISTPPHVHNQLMRCEEPQVRAALPLIPPAENGIFDTGEIVEDVRNGLKGEVLSSQHALHESGGRTILSHTVTVQPVVDGVDAVEIERRHLVRVFEVGQEVAIWNGSTKMSHGWVIPTDSTKSQPSQGDPSPMRRRQERHMTVLIYWTGENEISPQVSP